jgi:hypothetical protein
MKAYRIYNRINGGDWGVWEAENERDALEQLAREGGGVVTDRDDETVDWHRRIDPRDWIIEPLD